MSESRRKSVDASNNAMFVVNLGSGLVAGAAAAVLSQVCCQFFLLTVI